MVLFFGEASWKCTDIDSQFALSACDLAQSARIENKTEDFVECEVSRSNTHKTMISPFEHESKARAVIAEPAFGFVSKKVSSFSTEPKKSILARKTYSFVPIDDGMLLEFYYSILRVGCECNFIFLGV